VSVAEELRGQLVVTAQRKKLESKAKAKMRNSRKIAICGREVHRASGGEDRKKLEREGESDGSGNILHWVVES
jgi:hypothetical protein